MSEARRQGLFSSRPGQALQSQDLIVAVKSLVANLIARDWNLLLSQMSHTLDEIDIKMADNTQLRDNVPTWQRLLCSWRVGLVEYTARLHEAKDLVAMHLHNSDLEGFQDPTALFEILLAGIQKIEMRVTHSFQALMSSMAIIESEKAIVQGVAITRLTELAFFFIPLSFAAGFFSMQVEVCTSPSPIHTSEQCFED